MADVDTAPKEPETLGTVGTTEDTADVTEPTNTEADPEATESRDKRDSPEGSRQDGENPQDDRPSPEGAKDGYTKGDDQEATNDNSENGAITASEERPDVVGQVSPLGEKEVVKDGENNKEDARQAEKAEEKETPAENQGVEKERVKSSDGRGGDDAEYEDDTGRGGRGGEDEDEAGRGGEGGGNLPPTPTFDSDEDDTNRAHVAEALAKEATQADTEETADETKTATTARTPVQVLASKRLTNTPLEGAGPALKPHTAQLPPVARGQVRGQQISSSISDALKYGTQPSPKQLIRSRRPPKYIRLATVTVSPARTRSLPHGPSLYYEEPRRPKKVITWDEATNARPPLRIDMEGPTACSYTPRVKPLNETNAPSFTFGSKCIPEKAGGARTSWSKSWFQTPHVWHTKVDFTRDGAWPSPNHYPKGPSIGPRQRTMPEAPSYTFGHKTAYSIIKPGAPKEPSPNEYKRQTADKIVLPRGPSFTHQLRREGTTLWGNHETTPGPAAYSPNKPSPERPSFTIQGIRREKSHILGPYCPL